MHQGCKQVDTDRAQHIADYVVKLISDSHNVNLRRLLMNTKRAVMLKLVSTIIM